MLHGGGWGKKGAVNCFQHWAPRLRLKTFPSIAEGYFVHPFTESWLVLNAPFSKWCPSGRLRDHPALAVSLTCHSPASCANPGYSSLPSGAWRPKEWVPSCSPPRSGGEEPTQELLPQCPGPREAECFRETYVPCWRCRDRDLSMSLVLRRCTAPPARPRPEAGRQPPRWPCSGKEAASRHRLGKQLKHKTRHWKKSKKKKELPSSVHQWFLWDLGQGKGTSLGLCLPHLSSMG